MCTVGKSGGVRDTGRKRRCLDNVLNWKNRRVDKMAGEVVYRAFKLNSIHSFKSQTLFPMSSRVFHLLLGFICFHPHSLHA